MEITAAKSDNCYTDNRSLADRIKAHLAATGISISAMSKTVGYSRTTISRYLSGTYDSDLSDIETRLAGYLSKNTGELFTLPTPQKPVRRPRFFESRDAKSILGVCQSSQEYTGLGIVVGRSGFGKTHTLKEYAKLPRVAYIECDDTMASRDLVEAIEKALGIPRGYGTIWSRVNSIRDYCNTNKGYLLIIDEADKLISKYTQKKMEILRAIFDQADVGLVISGEPKLEAQIRSYLERMANRVDFCARLHGLSSGEVEEYLDGQDIDPDALTELRVRACNAQMGCFRLLDRTLSNVFRILSETGSESITLKVIEQASSMMML